MNIPGGEDVYRPPAPEATPRPAKRLKKASLPKPGRPLTPSASLPPSSSGPGPLAKKRPFDLVSAAADEDMDGQFAEEDFPMIRCGWNDCRQGFWILEDLLDHLVGENGHVPPDPSAPRGQKCPCEWTGCPKQGKPQGSRMALLVHLRSHTGEKPFSCHKPECDKTFSRTDALAKHVRVSHGETLPSLRTMQSAKLSANAGAGGGRKVKAENDSEHSDEPAEESCTGPTPAPTRPENDLLELVNARGRLFDEAVDEELRTDEERRGIEALKIKFPSSDPTFLELVVMKAKIKFALGERELLKAELQVLETKEQSVQREKDDFLDEIMKKQIGAESATLWKSSIDALGRSPSVVSPSSGQMNQCRIKSSAAGSVVGMAA